MRAKYVHEIDRTGEGCEIPGVVGATAGCERLAGGVEAPRAEASTSGWTPCAEADQGGPGGSAWAAR